MTVEQIIPKIEKFEIKNSTLWNGEFPLEVSDERTVDFLNALSKNIFSNPILKTQPQFVALAFWLRKSNVLKLIERSNSSKSLEVYYTPLGVVFHICPSNVDTMFVYSLAISLLQGNKNILRISKRNELGIISNLFSVFNAVLNEEKFQFYKNYISVISYAHEEDINNFLSLNSDARVIWGGDKTISTFKHFKSSARSKDIVFADRISLSIFNAEEYLKLDPSQKSELVKKFYNDTYVFDQKGCSSPQAIFVLGTKEFRAKFKEDFYSILNNYSKEHYQFDAFSIASLKLNNAVADIAESVVEDVIWKDSNLLFSNLGKDNFDVPHSCGAGYFYLIDIDNISDIRKFLNKKTQTLTYFGLEKKQLKEIVEVSNANGIDRIVPIGTALDFDFMWDGYNLFEELSSKKVLKY